jgi:hypothetical protein
VEIKVILVSEDVQSSVVDVHMHFAETVAGLSDGDGGELERLNPESSPGHQLHEALLRGEVRLKGGKEEEKGPR